jgi:RHS repeat-associated protein
MVYDPLGRLFQVSVPGKTIQFLYDGDAIVAEYNASTGALISRFAHGDQVDEPLLQYSGASLGSSARSYLHADHQGSIIAQSSSSGAIKARLAYDPYGIPASGNALRFGYTGQMYLSTLGLNYYKARWYSPKLGRFLQTDPIFYADDMNMYAYVGGDPLNRTDPTGEDCVDPSSGPCETVLVAAQKIQPPDVSRAAALAVLTYELAAEGGVASTVGVSFATVGVAVFGTLYPSSLADATCTPVTRCNVMTAEQKRSDQSRKSKPTNAPAGTKPIDKVGLSKDETHKVKDGQIGPEDWAGVAPNGDVVTTNPDGTANTTDIGNLSDYDIRWPR